MLHYFYYTDAFYVRQEDLVDDGLVWDHGRGCEDGFLEQVPLQEVERGA